MSRPCHSCVSIIFFFVKIFFLVCDIFWTLSFQWTHLNSLNENFLFANLPRYHYKTVASTFHNIVTSFQDYCHICNVFTHRHIGNILRYISSTLSSMYSVSKRFSKCTNPYWKPNPKRAIIASEVVLDFISRNHYNMYIKNSIGIFRFFESPL